MENSKNTILPDFKKESPFGYMPYILSLVIGYSLFLVIFLLLLNVDKAKHLVFYDFDRVDPFFSTYLVFIYGFLCAGIFVHHIKTDPLFTDRENLLKNFFPEVCTSATSSLLYYLPFTGFVFYYPTIP
ncbi:MAG: hypothetical protein IPL63_00925 [Saprospiraceae bacterium]|nr:hypothetical protein [Saprospiraceae bacterium]